MEKDPNSGNCRFIFYKSIIDIGGYLLIGVGSVFLWIIQCCDTESSIYKYDLPYIKSFFLSSLTFYYNLFYISGIKSIPNNISDYLGPISLAYWIINSGYKIIDGTCIYIYSYTLKDIALLQNALLNNFNLVSFPITNKEGKTVLFIPIKQITPLSYIVEHHIINSDYINNPL